MDSDSTVVHAERWDSVIGCWIIFGEFEYEVDALLAIDAARTDDDSERFRVVITITKYV